MLQDIVVLRLNCSSKRTHSEFYNFPSLIYTNMGEVPSRSAAEILYDLCVRDLTRQELRSKDALCQGNHISRASRDVETQPAGATA